MNRSSIQQPTGIIKTMPMEFFTKLPKGLTDWELRFMGMNNPDNRHIWIFNLTGRPKYEVLYFYINFDGAIRYRANIVGYEGGHDFLCYDNTIHYGKAWVQVCAPVIKLKEPIPMQGFQGFRYAYEVYK